MTPDEQPQVEVDQQVDAAARQLVNVINSLVQITQIDSPRQRCLDEFTYNTLATALRHLQGQFKKYIDWDDDSRRGCILGRHQNSTKTTGPPR